MEISEDLKNFIRKNAHLINNNEFDTVIENLNRDFSISIYEANIFINALYSAGIDPLIYMKKMPLAFMVNNLDVESVKIPANITEISSQAFRGCTNLKSVHIEGLITKIGVFAFARCTSLKDIFYRGTIKQWNNINIDDVGNAVLFEPGHCIIHCKDADALYSTFEERWTEI